MRVRFGAWMMALAVAAACSKESTPPVTGGASGGAPAPSDASQINGMGATFPAPIYTKWFSEYNKLHPNVRINYQPQGSGAGIRGLLAGTVFFGASDQPMKDEQMTSAPSKVLHFPTVIGGVVPVYNLREVSQELKFTGPLIADIILGKVKKWNDPAIAKLNPGVKLPPTDIAFVHRSEGSGTTFVLADFLGKISPEFKKTVGVDASLKWPVGVGAKGNEGVSGLVQQTPGAFGYVELVYALQNNIAFGPVENSAGTFVKASVDSVTAAAAGAAENMPEDFRVSITNAPGKDAYPISSFTWLLLYEEPKDKAQAKIMVDFLRWALTEGQKYAKDLGYAPLPQAVIDRELKALEKIKLS